MYERKRHHTTSFARKRTLPRERANAPFAFDSHHTRTFLTVFVRTRPIFYAYKCARGTARLCGGGGSSSSSFKELFSSRVSKTLNCNICLGRSSVCSSPTKIVLLRVITMLSSSLAGTKVTAATRVQTVKRNTTVRAATQKMGAKGKKRGGKVRVALSFYFVMENCAPQISLSFVLKGESVI